MAGGVERHPGGLGARCDRPARLHLPAGDIDDVDGALVLDIDEDFAGPVGGPDSARPVSGDASRQDLPVAASIWVADMPV